MKWLSDRHLVLAFLVAPCLALVAWWGVGQLTTVKATPAQVGANYPLVAASSCRYVSGRCELSNGDLILALRYDSGLGQWVLEASHRLDRILLEFVEDSLPAGEPQAMSRVGEAGTDWLLEVAKPQGTSTQLHLVASGQGSHWYGETGLTFIHFAPQSP